MGVRAKFRCNAIQTEKQVSDGSILSKFITLDAVISDSEDNKSWSKWTPSGRVTINITNPDAFQQFEQGKDYYLDFTPVASAEDSGGSNPPGPGQPGHP